MRQSHRTLIAFFIEPRQRQTATGLDPSGGLFVGQNRTHDLTYDRD